MTMTTGHCQVYEKMWSMVFNNPLFEHTSKLKQRTGKDNISKDDESGTGHHVCGNLVGGARHLRTDVPRVERAAPDSVPIHPKEPVRRTNDDERVGFVQEHVHG